MRIHLIFHKIPLFIVFFWYAFLYSIFSHIFYSLNILFLIVLICLLYIFHIWCNYSPLNFNSVFVPYLSECHYTICFIFPFHILLILTIVCFLSRGVKFFFCNKFVLSELKVLQVVKFNLDLQKQTCSYVVEFVKSLSKEII